ncbi:MAG: calcium/sodium antiporter [Anaerolineae bacterium]
MEPLTLALFIIGLIILIAGAELLVRGASRLAIGFGISPLVVGLTVVAFGTSSPELAVSIGAAAIGQADIVLGNVVGSNIANVLLILGISATITPLVVAQKLVRRDVPLMIGASFLLLLLGLDGKISRLEGVLMVAGIVGYTVVAVRVSRQEPSVVRAEYAAEFGECVAPGIRCTLINIGLIIVGLVMLTSGAQWLVNSAVSIAQALGLSELIIGLTVIAVGTSLPEIATSIVASLRGERDIAVGNVVGSNLFNILFVLGATAAVGPNSISVPAAALQFDIPFMIAVAVACLPIFFTGYRIARWEGVLFLAYYAAYTVYLLLDAMQHFALRAYNVAMVGFVMPLTAATFGLLAVRAWREGRPSPREDGTTQ